MNIPKKMMIRNRISMLRKVEGVTQEEMAQKLGIERTYLSKLENSKFMPRPELMVRICRYLGKELGEVFYIDTDTE